MKIDCVNRKIRGPALIATIENGSVNVIDRAVREGLRDACIEARALLEAGRIDRLVIVGAGKTFVARADVKEFDKAPIAPRLPDVLRLLVELPAVAAVNGAALVGDLKSHWPAGSASAPRARRWACPRRSWASCRAQAVRGACRAWSASPKRPG